MNDHELLHDFVTQASQPAFRQLVERHTPWLYSVCLRRLRDPALAEDAAQAVFLALAQKAPSLMHEPTLSPWLHQAAKFVAAKLLRAQARRIRHESEAAAMTPTQSPAPQWKDIEADLEPALDRLPFRDRQILLLRFYEQKSHPEIAATLHISEPAAAKRVERALERLRHILSPKSAPLSSATLSSLLLTHTLATAPATLTATAATATTSLAKGALTAMALAKLQTAAIITAAVLMILIPTTIVIYTKNSPQPTSADIAVQTQPASQKEVLRTYALKPNEVLKHIPSANDSVRLALWRELFADQPEGSFSPVPLAAILPQFDDNGTFSRPATSQSPFSLFQLLHFLAGICPQDLEGNAVRDLPLAGDFVMRPNARPEQYIAALEAIMQNDFHLSVALAFRNVDRKAIVLSGHWKFTPLRPENAPMHRPHQVSTGPTIDVYSQSLDTSNTFGWPAWQKDFAGDIGAWIHQPVINEATGLPPATGMIYHDDASLPFDLFAPEFHWRAHDKTLVLNHITEQTGLRWREETRPIRHLFIESPTP